jgi:hypothetical protein
MEVFMNAPSSWRELRPWKRHSLVLMVAGLIYVLIGIANILTKPTPDRVHALTYALQIAPMPVWGAIFVIAGILSIVSSRWPPVSKTWGYTVLTGLSAAWAGFYAVGIVFGDTPPSNLSGVLAWGLIGFMWWAISGLMNPGEDR